MKARRVMGLAALGLAAIVFPPRAHASSNSPPAGSINPIRPAVV